MTDLHKKKCIPCEGGTPSFNLEEIHKYLKKVDGWDVKKNEEKNYFLEKEFKFKDFKNSQIFINKVGEILEQERSVLLKIRNFGSKSLEELYARLDELGFLPEETNGEDTEAINDMENDKDSESFEVPEEEEP